MDIKLSYTEQGRGEPLFLLHGNGEDHHYFQHQIMFFCQYYRVIAVDTRGHGSSPRGTAPFTIRQFADDLYELFGQLEITKGNILGFSDGGNIALTFALSHPELVNKLILNGANLHPRGVKRQVQIPIEIGYRIAQAFTRRSPKAKANAEMLGLMVNEPNINPSELNALKMPVLVLAGTKDMISKQHTEQIQHSIPQSKLCFIKGDHFIANKNPEEFNSIVFRFLQE